MSARPETIRRHAISRIERATTSLDIARESQVLALVVGHEQGLTLRDLAAASGLGVETVRRILRAEDVDTSSNTNGGEA